MTPRVCSSHTEHALPPFRTTLASPGSEESKSTVTTAGKMDAGFDYERMSCPSCGATPGALQMDPQQSMVSCKECGHVLAENVVTTGASNLTFDVQGGRHGYLVKSVQAHANLAGSLNNMAKQGGKFGGGHFGGYRRSSSHASKLDSSIDAVLARPLRSLTEKLKLPWKVQHEIRCLFGELAVSEKLLTTVETKSPPPKALPSTSSPAKTKRSSPRLAKADEANEDGDIETDVEDGEGTRRRGKKKRARRSSKRADGDPGPSATPLATPERREKGALKDYSHQDVNILAGACVYAACRMHHVPVLLEEIAEATNCTHNILYHTSSKMQRTMSLILPPFDLQAFLVKCIGLVKEAKVMGDKPSANGDFQKILRARSEALLRFCESKYITTGRKLVPMVSAIIFKAITSFGLAACEHVTLGQITSCLRCSLNTAEHRVKDIQTCLRDLKRDVVEKSRGMLPLLPRMEEAGDQARDHLMWSRADDVPDDFVLRWVSNLQNSKEETRDAAKTLLGTSEAPVKRKRRNSHGGSAGQSAHVLEDVMERRLLAWKARFPEIAMDPILLIRGKGEEPKLLTSGQGTVGAGLDMVDDAEIDGYLNKPKFLGDLASELVHRENVKS